AVQKVRNQLVDLAVAIGGATTGCGRLVAVVLTVAVEPFARIAVNGIDRPRGAFGDNGANILSEVPGTGRHGVRQNGAEELVIEPAYFVGAAGAGENGARQPDGRKRMLATVAHSEQDQRELPAVTIRS